MNIKSMANKVRKHGRRGDTVLAHINPKEAKLLKRLGGAGTINPDTGALEFYDASMGEEGAGSSSNLGGGIDAGGYGNDGLGMADAAIAAGYGPESLGWGSPVGPGIQEGGGLFDNLGSRLSSPAGLGVLGSTASNILGVGPAVGGFLGNMLAAAINPDQSARAGMGAMAALSGPTALGFGLNAMAQALGAKPDPEGRAAALSGTPDQNVGLNDNTWQDTRQDTPTPSASGMKVNRLTTPDWALRELYGNMRFKKGGFINKLARAGRNGDNRLMHVSSNELRDLNRLTPGGLTINPRTGLPEAFKLKDFLKYAAPIAAFAAPVIGEAAFGTTPGGFLADLVGLGGSKIAGGVGDAAIGALLGLGGRDPLGGVLAGLGGNLARGDILGMFGTGSAPQLYEWPGEGSNLASGIPSVRPPAPASPQGSWIDRNSGLVGAGLGALALAGAATPSSPRNDQINNRGGMSPGFNNPLAPVSFDRTQINPRLNWYRIGRDPGPIMFFDDPRGQYTPMARGGSVNPLKRTTRPTTTSGRRRHSIMNSVAQLSPSKGGQPYIRGSEGGQDDTRLIVASPGEYVMDATTVADLGDGNSEAGARKLDRMRNNIARHKGRKKRVPDAAKRPEAYLR
jgi:hypothetical protein